jgi:hypothetical protein
MNSFTRSRVAQTATAAHHGESVEIWGPQVQEALPEKLALSRGH